MFHLSLLSFILLAVSPLVVSATATNQGTVHAISKSKYSRSHSLGDEYQFDARDGWQSINVTNLPYKYANSSNPHGGALEKRRKSKNPLKKHKHTQKPAHNTQGGSDALGGTLKHILGGVWNGLKAIGKPEPVIITWYTGHDLLNPSCWSNGNWHPTDASFAAALTLEGWTTRPQCFNFLELCNGPKKCVFVRVVDTCAGCAKGSKHVDLTRAPFGELASYDQGTLTVQLRLASEPTGWYEDLWGPKHK